MVCSNVFFQKKLFNNLKSTGGLLAGNAVAMGAFFMDPTMMGGLGWLGATAAMSTTMGGENENCFTIDSIYCNL